MPRYLFRASCRREGPSERRTSLEHALEAVAGTLETFSYGGDADVIAIAELPAAISATTFVSAVSASGAVQVLHTVLITPWGG